MSQLNLDINTFLRATASVRTLWDVFVHLMRVLGGCLIYMSIGSAGPDEFAVVERFVRTVRRWDGPPIWVTMVHPYNAGFAGLDTATDLDGLYDVHPSLTTTDALHHVLMLELDIHQVSETIQSVLWEAVWRETRYASVGISFARVMDTIQTAADELSVSRQQQHEVEDSLLLLADEDRARELWRGGVQRWINNTAASNGVREQIQRHLDIVALALPGDMRAALGRHLKRLVLLMVADSDEDHADADDGDGGGGGCSCSFASRRSMTQPQRTRVWDRMRAAIVPAAEAMFCASIRALVADALGSYYSELPGCCQNARQAGLVVLKLMDERFGVEGGRWRRTMSGDAQLMVGGIVEAIMAGFVDTIEALSEPEEEGHGERDANG